MISNRIRYFNKYITNPLLRRFANASRGPFAVIRHTGRRSGKPYETTIMVWPMGDGFVIALTYGPKVDWYRNLLAAGDGTLLWHGREYAVGKPEPIDDKAALPAFSSSARMMLRLSGVQHFVRVKVIEPEPMVPDQASLARSPALGRESEKGGDGREADLKRERLGSE